MTQLLLDSGNSRLKWAWADGTTLTAAGVLWPHPDELAAQLDEAWGGVAAPQSVTIAHVGDAERMLILDRWMRARWACPVHVVRAQAELLGVRNHYDAPALLGVDRWVALIAVRGMTTASACVIDCGTAVTIDALSADGDFLGGVILPGLALQRAALARGTAALDTPPGNGADCLARSTANAIAAGTLYGLAGAIERVVFEFESAMDEELELYITGGNLDEIAAHLARPVRRDPDLVLRGLARIAGIA